MKIIKDQFGSYRGLVTHLQTFGALLLGRYAVLSRIDWSRVDRLVFVCKGNVCRSPYAEMKARTFNIASRSFGLETAGGTPANVAAQRVALTRGLDLSSHRSTLFDASQIHSNDLVIGFEPLHVEKLLSAKMPGQTTLLGLWSSRFSRPYIADPYGKSDEYFNNCFRLIDCALEEIADRFDSSKSHVKWG